MLSFLFGQTGSPDQVCITESGIFGCQSSCSFYQKQESSSLAVIWSWKDYLTGPSRQQLQPSRWALLWPLKFVMLWSLLCSYIHQLQIALHLESGVNYLIHQQNGIEQHNLFERMSQVRSSCFLLYALSCSWFCKFLLSLELHISFSVEQILVAALKRTWDFVSWFTAHELLLERPLFTTGAKP